MSVLGLRRFGVLVLCRRLTVVSSPALQQPKGTDALDDVAHIAIANTAYIEIDVEFCMRRLVAGIPCYKLSLVGMMR